MKFLIILALCASSFAATPITVTGISQSGNAGGLKGNSFTRFRLRNFAGFVPRVVGTGIIVQTQFDVRPSDSLGNFTTPIYSNDDIVPNTCDPGGVTACTWWTVEYWNDGKISFSGNYCIPNTAPTYDLTMATPCQTPPMPAAPAQPFGTVTSVGFTGDGVVYNSVVPGSPITTFGTFVPTLHTHAANTIFAGPTTGGVATPTFRALVLADIPNLFPLLAPDGTVGAPSYSWANEPGSGWYRNGTNTFDFARGGLNAVSFLDDVISVDNGGGFCISNTTDAEDCSRVLAFSIADNTFEMFNNASADIYANLRLHKITLINNSTNPGIDWTSLPLYMLQAAEVVTPISPAPTFQKSYFKAGKGWCSVNSAGVESCSVKTGTSPIVVTGDVISCPTCTTTQTIKILSGVGPYTCSGDQNVCAFTLTWPSAWPDTNYTAVCDPVGPTNTTGSQSINNGGHGNLTTTTIDVYMTVNGSSSQSYSSWTCHGIHN